MSRKKNHTDRDTDVEREEEKERKTDRQTEMRMERNRRSEIEGGKVKGVFSFHELCKELSLPRRASIITR